MIWWLKWLHRWTSLIVALQVLIWLVTGLYFALVGHTEIAAHQHFSVAPKTTQSGLPFLGVGGTDVAARRLSRYHG